MSESSVETDSGETGEVDTSAQDDSAEDQAAEEALYDLMQEQDPEELQKQVEHWRKAAQKHERTARDNSAAAKKLRELEDANKSDLEKAVSAREAAERERDAVLMERTRSTAAAAHDLDAGFADFLTGSNEEEINTSADQLAELIKTQAEKLAAQIIQQGGGRAPGGARNGRPVESMRPGAAPTGAAPTSADDMFRQLLTGNR